MALRNLLVRVGADLSNFEQGMNRAGKKLQEFQAKVMGFRGGVAGALGGALAGIGTGLVIGQGIEDAIKYEALMGTLSETMGQSIHDFQKWQNQVGSSMGFSKLQGAELGNTLSLNFKKISNSHEDLVKKTTKMMEVAGRIAIKRGMTMEEVSDRIRSAMNQEADGADELGVNVRIAAIQQSEAYRQMADGRPWDKLTENMRKTILYHHILEQTAKTLGEEFQDNTQLRMINFVASLKDVRLALGQAFLPILHTVLPILTSFARAIERALQVTTQFFYSLFGYKGGTKQATKNAKAYSYQSETLGELGDASEEAGDKIKKAGAEAKRGIADFDEIHELPEPSKAGAGAKDKDKGLGEDMLGGDETLPLYQGLVNWMDEIGGKAEDLGKRFRKWFKESEGMKDLINGLENLWLGFEKIATSKSVKWVIKQFAEDLPAFFDDLSQIAGGFFSLVGGALEEIGYLLDGDFKNAWKGTETMFGGAYDIFSGTVGLIFPDLSKAMDNFMDNKFLPRWAEFKKAWMDGEKPIRTAIEGIRQKLTIDLINAIIEVSKRIKTEWDLLPTRWNNITSSIGQKWKETVFNMPTWMQDALRRTQDGFNKTFMPIIDKARTKIDQLVRAWNKMDISFGEALVGAFKIAYNMGAGKINGLIDLINKMVKKLNDLPMISGIPRIDYKIPYLAKGGIVSSPTVAMIGEAGAEAVTPIDKLQGMITSAVVSAMQFNTGSRSGGDIVLNLDGRAFARIINPYLDVEQKRIGANVRLNTI